MGCRRNESWEDFLQGMIPENLEDVRQAACECESENAALREQLADANNVHADNEVDLLLTAIGVTQHTYEPRHVCINRAREEAKRLNASDKQNAALREELAAVRANGFRAFTDDELLTILKADGTPINARGQTRAEALRELAKTLKAEVTT